MSNKKIDPDYKVKSIIQGGYDEVKNNNNSEIKPEHIIISMLKNDNIISNDLLKNIIKDDIISDMILLLKQDTNIVYVKNKGDINLSKDVKKIINDCENQAIKLNDKKVNVEHLFLSILNVSKSVEEVFKLKINMTYDTVLNYFKTIKMSYIENNDDDKIEIKRQPLNNELLLNFTKDLTDKSNLSNLEPVIGRDEEIDIIIRILGRKKKSNPILLGDPGVGKTHIVNGVARRILLGDCPEYMKDYRILSLDITSLISGTKYRGQFEERVTLLLKELKKNRNIILFIDEMHTLMGAGSASGSLDFSNMIKPALSEGEISIIGATTYDEYKLHIEKDAAFKRRLQEVFIDEPSLGDTKKILYKAKKTYEDYHKINISQNVIDYIVEKSEQYIPNKKFPDKAFDIIDELGSKTKMIPYFSNELFELENKILELENLKEHHIKQSNYEQAGVTRDEIALLKNDYAKLKNNIIKNRQRVEINIDDVDKVISNISKIPLEIIKGDFKNIKNIKENLKKEVYGQDEPINEIFSVLKRMVLGLNNPKKPLATFLFLANTGVGKTLVAKNITKELFGSDKNMIRFDMSEYMEKHSVSKLIGSPPGYVGYEQSGILTEKVKNNPYSVILFDEIEKAHPDVLNILLQMFDEGVLSDNNGIKINFKNTIIILTSNIGYSDYKQENRSLVGFNRNSESDKKDYVDKKLKSFFKPELLNRIDKIIHFNDIDRSVIIDIANNLFLELKDKLRDKGVELKYNKNVVEMFVDKYYDKQYGVRSILRAFSNNIESNIIDVVVESDLNKINIKIKNNDLVFL